MARKVTIENLNEAIQDILEEYADDIDFKNKETIKEVSKAGSKALQNLSKSTFGGNGDYAKGWTYKIEEKRLYAKVIIHNKSEYRLAHLLENGHLVRNGTGRVKSGKKTFVQGKPHISTIEQKLIEDYTEGIIKAIK